MLCTAIFVVVSCTNEMRDSIHIQEGSLHTWFLVSGPLGGVSKSNFFPDTCAQVSLLVGVTRHMAAGRSHPRFATESIVLICFEATFTFWPKNISVTLQTMKVSYGCVNVQTFRLVSVQLAHGICNCWHTASS